MTLDIALSLPSITDAMERHHLAQSLGYQTVDAMIEAALEVAAGARCETCGMGKRGEFTSLIACGDTGLTYDPCFGCRDWEPKP